MAESAPFQRHSKALFGRRDEITQPDAAPAAPEIVQDALRTLEARRQRHEINKLRRFAQTLNDWKSFAATRTER